MSVRFGVLTDVHYGERDAFAGRHYREAPARLREAVDLFDRSGVPWVIELGDLVDTASTRDEELGWLRAIDAEYARFAGDRHYVPGNHCLHRLDRTEFLAVTSARSWPYAFSSGGVRFLVLDACFRNDGVAYAAGNFDWTDCAIPAFERDWLACQLSGAREPVVVFVHQRLDTRGDYAVADAPAVREILSDSGRVLAVLQGHEHENDERVLDGVRYITFAAMVEGEGDDGGACAIVEISDDGTLSVEGFRGQASYRFPPARCCRR